MIEHCQEVIHRKYFFRIFSYVMFISKINISSVKWDTLKTKVVVPALSSNGLSNCMHVYGIFGNCTIDGCKNASFALTELFGTGLLVC